MTDLPAVAKLITDSRIPEALELYRQTDPDAEVSAVFGSLLGEGHDESAFTLLKWEAARTGDLETFRFLIAMLITDERYLEAEPYADSLCRHEPGYYMWYSVRAWARFTAKDPEGVRAVIAEAQEKITDYGIDFQPSLPPDVSGVSAQLELAVSERRGKRGAGKKRKKGGKGAARKRPAGPGKATGALRVETLGAAERGTVNAVLSGRIEGASEPGHYCFRYGPAPDRLNSETPWKPLPPGTWSEVRAPVLETANQWRVCATEHAADVAEGGVRLSAPFGKDRNHMSGVGVADLLGAWCNTLPLQKVATRGQRASGLDLRDAEVVLRLRTDDLDPEDFLFTFNTQAEFTRNGTTFWAPWTLSGRPVDLDKLVDGDWRNMTVKFSATPDDWSFCGNNPAEQPTYERYSYAPLGTVLENQTRNLFLWMLYGDWRRTPKGTIWFSEARLRHRDWSVLRDGAFAALAGFPEGGPEDPGKLTDGRRGHPGDGWASAGLEAGPKTFEWRFTDALELTDVVLHQHPVFPTRDCLVEIVDPGGDAHQQKIRMADAGPSTRTPTAVGLPEGNAAKALRITLLDGYHDGGVGLEAVEAFSDAATPTPGGDAVSVSEDTDEVAAGGALFYRLCCKTGAVTAEGDTLSIDLPKDAKPLLQSLEPFTRGSNKAVFLVRGNAMGGDTLLTWWTDETDPATIPFGHETTRQHRAITLRGPALEAKTLYARLESDEGTSATLEAAIS